MNAKTAKKLRRKAREMTVGLPDRRLIRAKNGISAINDPKTTRGVYRALKKEASHV